VIAKYLNKRYHDLLTTYFDLDFEEDNNQMLRLGGVPFDNGFTNQDMIDRATEIFENNFSIEEYQLIEIITK
jgi:hypothetical protein